MLATDGAVQIQAPRNGHSSNTGATYLSYYTSMVPFKILY